MSAQSHAGRPSTRPSRAAGGTAPGEETGVRRDGHPRPSSSPFSFVLARASAPRPRSSWPCSLFSARASDRGRGGGGSGARDGGARRSDGGGGNGAREGGGKGAREVGGGRRAAPPPRPARGPDGPAACPNETTPTRTSCPASPPGVLQDQRPAAVPVTALAVDLVRARHVRGEVPLRETGAGRVGRHDGVRLLRPVPRRVLAVVAGAAAPDDDGGGPPRGRRPRPGPGSPGPSRTGWTRTPPQPKRQRKKLARYGQRSTGVTPRPPTTAVV